MLIFLILLLLIIGLYLNRSYAYFYNFIGQANLTSPVHEEVTVVGSKSGSQTIKYISLGDSLTAGVGVSDYKNSYPYLIAQKLSEKNNVELINLAHTGDSSTDLVTNQLPKILNQKPDFVTVLVGINDIHNLKSVKEFEDNYIKIVSTLKKSDAKIYLFSIPYLGSKEVVFFPYNLILDLRTRQFNNVIRKISATYNVQFIDLYSLNKSSDFYSADFFHPSAFGYKIWSEAVNVN